MKSLIITGGLGFIGSHFVRACLKKGWQCKVIDKCTYASNYDILYDEFFENHKNFSFEGRDINDLNHLYECDYIVNFAAESDVTRSINGSKDFIKTNVNGVHHLLELVRTQLSHKPPIFLQISTDEVYGDILKGSHKETDILKPSNPYSAAKASSDMLIQAWNRTYNLPYLIVRPTNNYGTHQYIEKLIPKAVKYINLGYKIPLHNNGSPVRSWLHVEDTVSGLITLIDKGVTNEIYNIGGSCEKSNKEVIHNILSYMVGSYKIDNYVDFNCNRPGQDVRYSLDDSKLRNLGWKPNKVFGEEVKNIIEYYGKQDFIW